MEVTGTKIREALARATRKGPLADDVRIEWKARLLSLLAEYECSVTVRVPPRPGHKPEARTLLEAREQLRAWKTHRTNGGTFEGREKHIAALVAAIDRGMQTPLNLPEVTDLEAY